MKEKDKISVIVPVYGTEKYVEKCLNSILGQTYDNVEILVVNDGSKDNSEDYIFKVVNNECRVMLKENTFKYIKLNIIGLMECKDVIVKIESSNIYKEYYYVLNSIAQNVLDRKINLRDRMNCEWSRQGEFCTCSDMEISGISDCVTIEFRKDSYCITGGNSKIRYIKHLVNRGLFQARLTGYEYSTGDFITTVDSDDYVGIDYYRLLHKRAVETNADVVVSEFVKVINKTNYKGKRTHGMQAIRGLDLNGTDILENFYKTEGEISVLWFVWGKLYRRLLWDKCYSDFCRVEGHHVMLEDMMYGTILSSKAHHCVWCDADTYFYVANEDASTSNNGGYSKLKKNIDDVIYAFAFIEKYLKKEGLYDKYESKLCKVKAKWSRVWYDIEKEYKIKAEQRMNIEELLEELSPEGILESSTERDTYFYDLCTPWDERIEQVKRKICKKEIISFDIFDTLVVRPFYQPSDLFILLDEEWVTLQGRREAVSFSEMRINAEKAAREKIKQKFPQFEEICLDEIYEEFEYLYDVSKEISEKIKQREVELEMQFCQPRKKICELYDMARYLGKTVVAVSDMYLPRYVIEKILKKCGCDYFDRIFISCEMRRTKANGGLFEVMLGVLGRGGEKCLHLGDNWNLDCVPAQKLGIETWRTAKPIDLLFNKVSDMNKAARRGNFGKLLERNSHGNFLRYIHADEYYGIRCMLAVIANKIFDNPYTDYEPDTDFNRNPYNVGYMALGMHDFAIVRWLIANNKNKKKIHFVARDGYLAKKIYEIVKQYKQNIPEADYFYMSRKSFLPLSVESKNDWWSIKNYITYQGKSPRELLEYYLPIMECNLDNLSDILWKYGVIADKPLENEMQYYAFVKAVQKELHSDEKIHEYRNEMKTYFSGILKPKEIMFDIGYSGRAQALLSKLLGYGLDAFFIHTLGDKALTVAAENNFELHTFYNYTPALTGKIRELIQSEPAPSCIGYKKNFDGIYKPVFENSKWCYHEYYVISQIHRGAMEFVDDFMLMFKDYMERMTYREIDASFIHESFILLPRQKDMEIFKLFHFEDDLLFGKDYVAKKLIQSWNGDLEWQNLKDKKAKTITNNNVQGNRKAVHFYRPYVAEVNPPKGLKKINYFVRNDHILLQKYMEKKYGGKIQYKIFDYLYKNIKKRHHLINGLNEVGNKREDFTLNNIGKLLYNATSAYGLFCCMLHKLTFHLEESADLMLSVWRKDKIDAVKETEIFEEIILWDDLKYRAIDYPMDGVLQNATETEFREQEWRFFKEYEKMLPFKISKYKEIIIAGNSMPFGCYLERNQVPYQVIEDGAGIYSNPALLLHFIQDTYPALEKYMVRKYKIFDGSKYCKKTYINYDAQEGNYSESNTVDFRPVKLVEQLPVWRRKGIMRVFNVKETFKVNSRKSCLLLTYPLAQREGLTISEEKMVYTLLADIFAGDYEEYHLKAHPDDRTDFSEIENFKIINRQVLSELLWYETKTEYDVAISAISTSTNNLLCVKKRIILDSQFSKEYKNLIKYFACIKMIKHAGKIGSPIVGIGLFDQMMEAIVLRISDGMFKYEKYSKTAVQKEGIAIIGREVTGTDIEELAAYRFCIFLERPQSIFGLRTICIHKIPKKYYSFVNADIEQIYISERIKWELPLRVPMNVTGIELMIEKGEEVYEY